MNFTAAGPGKATKFCEIPELLVMLAPLIVNVNVGLAVILNALAPALNTRSLTSVLADVETLVLLEVAKVAVSAGPFGGLLGVQLVALFQSPVAGVAFQVALPAPLD